MTMYKMNMSFDFNATFHYNDKDMDGMWSEEEYMGAFKAMDMNGKFYCQLSVVEGYNCN